jgi:membrane associated rhomboid family serine protease
VSDAEAPAFPAPSAAVPPFEPRRGARVCGVCNALNGVDFERCIRCGVALGARPGRAARAPLGVGGRIVVALTLVVFAGQVAVSLLHDHALPLLGGGNNEDALRFGALLVDRAALSAEPWRALSATFVHFGLLHVASNLLGLVWLARLAEPAIGADRFVLAYVGSGLAGWAASAVRSLAMHAPASLNAGASGAVFGLLGLVLGWMVRTRDPRWKGFAFNAVILSLAFGFALNGAGTLVSGKGAAISIDNTAHVGGLLFGLASGVAFAGELRAPRWLLRLGAALALVASVAALVWSQLVSA